MVYIVVDQPIVRGVTITCMAHNNWKQLTKVIYCYNINRTDLHNMIIACPRGQYRSASDTSCQTCPSNTVRSGRAVAECPCLVNYYRAANEGPGVACTCKSNKNNHSFSKINRN